MSTFEYKARTKEGEERTGVIETSSRDAALDTLHQKEFIVISLSERRKPLKLISSLPFFTRVNHKDVVIFSRQLATLFEARIPVVEALKTLIGETTRPTLRDAVAQILDDVVGGLAISQAMAKHPKIFSSFYVNLVRSGEESGKLQEVFTYLADYLERSYYLTKKATNATIYPAFVLVSFLGVLVVMLVAVVPGLISIFEETGQKVPFYTKIIIYLSIYLRQWGLGLVLLLVVGAVGVWRWSLTSRGELFFHRLQINIPILGELYRKLYMARVTDNLRTLIVGGIPILRALQITRDVVGNSVYKKSLMDAEESVKGGGTISQAFERTPEIPVLVTQMIRIGETSGKLDFTLGSIARHYQRDVDSSLENLVALIEPTLIIFLGIGVGVIVAAIMVPLYSLVGSL